jgi:hypothetical protein
MRYLQEGAQNAVLSTGEKYGFVKINSLSDTAENTPLLIPEYGKEENPDWHFFGVLPPESSDGNGAMPKNSSIDPFVSYGLLHGPPKTLAFHYAIMAYTMEAVAWGLLLLGISINVVFIFLILSLLRII